MHFRIKSTLAAALLLLIICPHLFAQQTFKIAKVEFEGLNKLAPDEMVATTELKVGSTFELAALDAAAQRLVDSGLFKNVAYRTKSNRDQITITFVVVEAKVATSRRDSALHSLTVCSSCVSGRDKEASREPSGLKATTTIRLDCPRSISRSLFLCSSQS